MKQYRAWFLSLVVVSQLALTGCGKSVKSSSIVSQTYQHAYGHTVSKDEFETRKYPGQVITLLKSGVTITATYEDGVLHGPCTHTFPHSNTIETYLLYNKGNLVKKLTYSVKGLPLQEEVRLSPTRYTMTTWYMDGNPKSIEEHSSKELLEGKYFAPQTGELESQVIKGEGERIVRNAEGRLLFKDKISGGYLTEQNSFYPNGYPESIAHYYQGKLEGEMKIFAENGEPLAVKNYHNHQLHGKVILFQNGAPQVESSYVEGLKQGPELHYVDGEKVSQELHWMQGKLHGPSKYYVGDLVKVEYFYDGKAVSVEKWRELDKLDQMVARMAEGEGN